MCFENYVEFNKTTKHFILNGFQNFFYFCCVFCLFLTIIYKNTFWKIIFFYIQIDFNAIFNDHKKSFEFYYVWDIFYVIKLCLSLICLFSSNRFTKLTELKMQLHCFLF